MSDPKDTSGKAGDRGAGASPDAKRPYATIDLKAVDVSSASNQKPATAQASAKAGAAGTQKPADAPKAPEAAKPRPQGEAAAKVAAAAAAQSAGKQGTGQASGATAKSDPQKPAAGSVPPAGRPAPAGRPQPARSGGGSGIGRFLSHTFAGIVGGALALYGAPQLASSLRNAGLPAPPSAEPSPALVGRIAQLEKQLAAPPKVDPAADPARAVAAADANAKRLDDLAGSLASLGKKQDQTAELAARHEAKLAKEPTIADAAERIVKLEQQLATLSAAAGTEPNGGNRIQQLAGITGRMSDLEGRLVNEVAGVRKDLSREIEARVAPAAEASEAARLGAQRVDREVSAVKSEQNRLATSLDQVKTTTERLALGLKSTKDEMATLSASVDQLRRNIDSRLQATAKPDDVSSAIAPVAIKLTSLEQNLAGVVKSEAERKATAERIVLALELGNLKRAMERGAPFARELSEVKKVAMSGIDLAPLEPYASKGVQTLPELVRGFRPVANALIDAQAEKADGGVVDRLLSGAKSFVRVRKTAHAPGDDSIEAVISRMEDGLKSGRLGDVVKEAKALGDLPPVAKDWVARLEARQSVDQALSAIDQALKSSLGAGPAVQEKKAKP